MWDGQGPSRSVKQNKVQIMSDVQAEKAKVYAGVIEN